MRRSPLVCGVGVIFCAGGLARASIEVKQYNGSDVQVGSTVTHSSGAAFDISIEDTTVRSIVVRSDATDPTTESIGRITVLDDAWGNDIKLYIAQTKSALDAQLYSSTSDRACLNWAGIEDQRDSGELALKAYIHGNLTGTIIGPTSSTGYTRLNTLQVDGVVSAKVYAQAGYFWVKCGSATRATGTAFWSDAGIKAIQAMSGDIDCDILANKNNSGTEYCIDLVEALSGQIGFVGLGSSGLITIGTISSANVSITKIKSLGTINAHINAPEGSIALIETTGVMVESDIQGTITAQRLVNVGGGTGLIHCTGFFAAELTLTEELPADSTIRMDWVFGSDGYDPEITPGVLITVPDGQLKGQVIVNWLGTS